MYLPLQLHIIVYSVNLVRPIPGPPFQSKPYQICSRVYRCLRLPRLRLRPRLRLLRLRLLRLRLLRLRPRQRLRLLRLRLPRLLRLLRLPRLRPRHIRSRVLQPCQAHQTYLL